MKKFSTIISAFLLFSSGYLHADIIMSPYLQAVTQNSIYVLVECNTADTATINFGLTPSYGNSAKTESIESTVNTPATYIHNVKLTGLLPNTIYYYRAVQGSSQSSGFSFKTAVQPGTNFRFVWMADCRSGTAVHDQISTLINLANPLFSIYGGDLCYNSTYAYWKSEFFRSNELTVISHIPFFEAPGNHEGWNQNTMSFTQAPNAPLGFQDYYSFDYGDMHVLVLNNQISYGVGSAQYNFAVSDLANASKQWKVVVSHNPAYCSGGHGEDANMITMSQNVFVPNHVDIVISGHSHFYQHNFVSNIHHLIIGSAGAPLVDPTTAGYTIKSVKDFNYSVIDVTPTAFNMIIYNNINTILDSIKLIKPPMEINNEHNYIPKEYNLFQNYPNPFNPITKINFDIPKTSFTKLVIYNLLGNQISLLVNANLKQGHYSVDWDGSNFPSGVYYYKLQSEKYYETKKMVVLK